MQPPSSSTRYSLSFSHLDAVEHYKLSRPFKFHVLLASLATAVSGGLWLFIAFFTSQYPWFIYVATFFCITVSFHFYILVRPKEILQLHITWFVVINTMLFLTWLFQKGHEFTWFLYPIFGWGVLLALHYGIVAWRDDPHKWISVHTTIFVLVNLMCFFLYIDSGHGKPWFLYVFFGTGALLLIHFCAHYYPGNWFTLHLYLFADIQLLLFCVWAGRQGFPWFFFVLLGWGVLLAVHFKFSTPPQQLNPLDPEFGYPPPTPQPQQGYVGSLDQQSHGVQPGYPSSYSVQNLYPSTGPVMTESPNSSFTVDSH